jgi:hypothetical protein
LRAEAGPAATKRSAARSLRRTLCRQKFSGRNKGACALVERMCDPGPMRAGPIRRSGNLVWHTTKESVSRGASCEACLVQSRRFAGLVPVHRPTFYRAKGTRPRRQASLMRGRDGPRESPFGISTPPSICSTWNISPSTVRRRTSPRVSWLAKTVSRGTLGELADGVARAGPGAPDTGITPGSSETWSESPEEGARPSVKASEGRTPTRPTRSRPPGLLEHPSKGDGERLDAGKSRDGDAPSS